jgi:hypothetical protein
MAEHESHSHIGEELLDFDPTVIIPAVLNFCRAHGLDSQVAGPLAIGILHKIQLDPTLSLNEIAQQLGTDNSEITGAQISTLTLYLEDA